MSRKTIAVFAVWQILGAVGFLFWNRPQDTAALWVVGLVLLLPGNAIASAIVTAALWRSPLSLEAMSAITLALAIAINFACWFAVARVMRWLRQRPKRIMKGP